MFSVQILIAVARTSEEECSSITFSNLSSSQSSGKMGKCGGVPINHLPSLTTEL